MQIAHGYLRQLIPYNGFMYDDISPETLLLSRIVSVMPFSVSFYYIFPSNLGFHLRSTSFRNINIFGSFPNSPSIAI
jgi:hypothetical protein